MKLYIKSFQKVSSFSLAKVFVLLTARNMWELYNYLEDAFATIMCLCVGKKQGTSWLCLVLVFFFLKTSVVIKLTRK